MTIIVFLVDTSASMQQRCFVNGRSTLLDVAKGAVEFFVKTRQKSPESRGDRYMLLTFEEYPRNIKAGWKENLQTFMNELKNLDATGMTTMGTALKQVFDTLNVNRMQTGIDMYGQGRYPFYLEPAVIIVISDGGRLTTQAAVQQELNLPMHSSVPGSELTREPFRWDQRLYALVLRLSGTPPSVAESGGHVASDNSPIDAMCEVTGGRSFAVTSQRVLHQCIDSLVQKLQSGVVIHFEKMGPDPPPLSLADKAGNEDDDTDLSRADTIPLDDLDVLGISQRLDGHLDGPGDGLNGSNASSSRPHTPNPILSTANTAWHSCRRLIYVPRSAQKGFAVGFWPLPEAFWPDMNAPSLPQRSAHPSLRFTCLSAEPMIIDNLPFDKYELEPSPLTLYILARRQPKACWQVHVQGSARSVVTGSGAEAFTGHPFGYLKASTNLLSVNLFVLPYNYPVLLPLLDELFKVHRLKPSNEWRNQLHAYLRTMPAYYAGPLRRALTRMGAGNLAASLIPETLDNCLSYTVLNYLKRLRNQAKLEFERTLSVTPVTKARPGPEGIKVIPRSPFKMDLVGNHLLKDKFSQMRDQLTDFRGFQLQIGDATAKVNKLRNPFDIPRSALLDQLIRMRANFLQPSTSSVRLVEDDAVHSMPIAQMGNYQDYLKKMPVPLREIESQPVRQHMFGNPFKINKNMILDEVVDEVGLVTGQAGMGMGGAPPTAKSLKRMASASEAMPALPPSKRMRKGPLPKDFVYRRTPPGTPSSTPTHMSAAYEDYPDPDEAGLFTPPPSPAVAISQLREQSEQPEMAINGSANDSDSDREESDSDEEKPLVISRPPENSPAASLDEANVLSSQEPFRLHEDADLIAQIEEVSVVGAGDMEVSAPNYVNGVTSNGSKSPYRVNAGSREGSPTPPQLSRRRTEDSDVEVLEVKAEAVDEVNDLSKEELRSVRLRNQNVRQMIYKEVKRPGRDHSRLFEMLMNELHGTAKIRKDYITEVVAEARRFKRKLLADMLEAKMDELTTAAASGEGLLSAGGDRKLSVSRDRV